jgi:hypothetical protein
MATGVSMRFIPIMICILLISFKIDSLITSLKVRILNSYLTAGCKLNWTILCSSIANYKEIKTPTNNKNKRPGNLSTFASPIPRPLLN